MVCGSMSTTSKALRPSTNHNPLPQVLFKRKPVQFLPVPEIDDEHQEVRTHLIPTISDQLTAAGI
jgi:hypothetical protein